MSRTSPTTKACIKPCTKLQQTTLDDCVVLPINDLHIAMSRGTCADLQDGIDQTHDVRCTGKVEIKGAMIGAVHEGLLACIVGNTRNHPSGTAHWLINRVEPVSSDRKVKST